MSRNVYDVTGQRVLRVEPDGSKTIYLGSSELRWTPGDPTIDVARHYPGGTHHQFDGSLTYTVSGHQGSVVASVDATTGTATYNRYLPYGELRAGATVDDRGFLGQTHDNTSSLVYLNNRHHDPTLGMFISVDPLVTLTGEPYIYGSANPVMLSDSNGLFSCLVILDDGTLDPLACLDLSATVEVTVGNARVETGFSGKGYGQDVIVRWCDSFASAASCNTRPIAETVTRPENIVTAGTVGIASGFCFVFLGCFEVGFSGEGPYIKPGVGLAFDFPSLVVKDENPDCGSEETSVYVSASVGPIGAAASQTRPGGSTDWDSQINLPISLPNGDRAPKLSGVAPGVGVVHQWSVC